MKATIEQKYKLLQDLLEEIYKQAKEVYRADPKLRADEWFTSWVLGRIEDGYMFHPNRLSKKD